MTRHYGKFVSYLRVSTKRQGESGLGLEAQRKAVADYLNGGRWELIEEHVEVRVGQGPQEPAGASCRANGLPPLAGHAGHREARSA